MRFTRPTAATSIATIALGAGVLMSCAEDPIETVDRPCEGPTDARLCIDVVASGLAFPLALAQAPGDDRVFVAEQPGRLRIIRDGRLESGVVLDLTDDVLFAPGQGLLGMTLHPSFPVNGHVFVAYTGKDEHVHVERYTVGSDPDRLDPSTRKELLRVPGASGPHSGGEVVFGPDGMLWIGMGDANEALNAQDSSVLHGALLRIDVDAGDPYAIPPDNPFLGVAGARGEIWAKGLRNPWRFSLDGGRLFVADVGQEEWEEINIVDADEPGLNFGWPVMEGSSCFKTDSCSSDGLVLPALEYDHSVGCSIIGGGVYEGTTLPTLTGRYLYGDHCGWIGSTAVDGMTAGENDIFDFGQIGGITSFGFDAAGEPWVLFHEGGVARIVPAPET